MLYDLVLVQLYSNKNVVLKFIKRNHDHMSAHANDVVCAFYHQVVRDCQHLNSIQQEMESTYEPYNRHRSLMREGAETRTRLLKMYGILGKYAPDISLSTAEKISLPIVSSCDIRRELKVWEILEAYLSAIDDKSTVAKFQRFLLFVQIDASSQAIESAIKAHSDLFEVSTDAGEKFVTLRANRAC